VSDLQNLGEFGLIYFLTEGLPPDKTVIKGIGDDCAVVRIGGEELLFSCDAFLEGVHFQRHWATGEDIGHKAAATALSDIAAMGGIPLYALITVAAPPDTDISFLQDVYTGLKHVFSDSQCSLIGGDTVSSASGLFLNVTVTGKGAGGRILYRRGMMPGDLIMVTGHPGASAQGLHSLLHEKDAPPSLLQAHRRPVPRLQEGLFFSGDPAVHAMIDISDGVSQDLMHMAQCSSVSVYLNSGDFPFSPDQIAYGNAGGLPALDAFLYGGEDYELALAVDPEQADALQKRFSSMFPLPLTVIGHAAAGDPELWMDGKTIKSGGWDHFQELK
jgi:thiamine-monophosphate kinase